MGIEIERKYLVDTKVWKPSTPGVSYMQGYLVTAPDRTIRVRIAGNKGFLTIKGRPSGLTRAEFEYEIPAGEAEELLRGFSLTPPVIKTRYKEKIGTHTWEIDVFSGENEGLVMAEIELSSEDEAFDIPSWAIKEVTQDPRYQNSLLAQKPFKHW